MSEDLKPCPFCGSPHVEVVSTFCPVDQHDVWKVVCDCEASGYGDIHRSLAVEAWNRRSPADGALERREDNSPPQLSAPTIFINAPSHVGTKVLLDGVEFGPGANPVLSEETVGLGEIIRRAITTYVSGATVRLPGGVSPGLGLNGVDKAVSVILSALPVVARNQGIIASRDHAPDTGIALDGGVN